MLVKLLLLKKLNKIVLIRFNMHLPFNIFSGSFPTAPDFNAILMDGTVFYADSNGMSVFFREMKKLQLFKVIFPIYL